MKVNKPLLFLFFFFAFSTLVAQQQALPSIVVKKLDGQNINIKEYTDNDKLKVLSFWATWCSPCKKELDTMADLYPYWQEDYNVEIIAVTIDTRRALSKVGPMVATKGWEYTILSDANQDLKNALNIQAVPHTLVIDGQGNIAYSHSGYLPGDEYELEDKLKELSERE